MNTPQGRRTCLYTAAQLDDIVADMARQAAGLLTGRTEVVIVGILRRGQIAGSHRYRRGAARCGAVRHPHEDEFKIDLLQPG
ncbi:MAG TPA: hypothetical protein PLE48_16290 [Thiobacillus sp.]|nr:hypothetical protein [Thiobacillus sp.]HQT71962.1 hypothetical protein [Thiobacillus sp.]